MTSSIKLATALLVYSATLASASMPVSFTVIGCVLRGKFSSEKYTFKVENEDGSPADLSMYEGATIKISGSLTPGDHLVGSYSLIDKECKIELHESTFR